MSFGLLSTGFVKKLLANIKTEIEDDLKGSVGQKLNPLASAVFGQLIGVVADKLRELWDVGEALYAAMYPDSATDAALDNVAAMTGAIRLKATKSTVTLDQMYLDPAVTVPLGSIVSVGATGNRFVTTAAVTSTIEGTYSVTAESQETGEITGYATEINTIQTPVSGWLDTPGVTCTTVETYSLDGTALNLKVDEEAVAQTVNFSGGDPWSASSAATFIKNNTTGTDTAAVSGYVRVYTTTSQGSIQITGGTANAVLNFPTALIKGFNSADMDIGRELETDPEFRQRREDLLQSAGAGTVEAIYANLRDVDDVEQVLVLENDTDVEDALGIPRRSIECVVQAGDDQEIADELWRVKPPATITHGSTSKTVTDSMGITHTVKFSRPTAIPIHLEYTLTTDADYPATGDAQVKAAVKAFGDTLQIGDDVIALAFKAIPLDIAGVVDVTSFKLDTVDPPTGTTNITIDSRSRATFDTADIDII